MNNWLKRGALTLVLGAFCTMSGAAMAEPKPSILTPPTKANPAAARAGANDKGKGEEKGKDGAAPGASASAAASAMAGSPPGPEDEKAKEERAAKAKAKMEERKAKAKEHRAEIKKKVEEKLKGQPMVAAMKEELKRHARRLARLERAKDVATDANDTETVARVDKLIAKENARHDKWMANFDAKAASGDKAGAK
jgi:hypothetical protein